MSQAKTRDKASAEAEAKKQVDKQIDRQINKQTMSQRMKTYRRSPTSLALMLSAVAAALAAVLVLLFIIGHVLINGVRHLTPDLFAWRYDSVNVSMLPAIINTLLMAFLALILAAPLGILSAVYLVEYAKRGNRVVEVVRITAETLAGIPSIVYGLFGLLFFATAAGWGKSLIAGACTLAIMILPLIMRSAEEALKAVPDSYREGSYSLGAGRLRTVFRIVLPSAMRGILAGVILAVGRIVGETAALIYTAGTVAEVPSGKDFLFDSTRTLSVHMYALSNEGFHIDQAYATAVVLLIMVIGLNWLSGFLAKKIAGGG